MSVTRMHEASQRAVYNSRVPEMWISSPRLVRPACLPLLVSCVLCLTTAPAYADWTSLEKLLAQKIVAATGPGAVAVQVVNRSSLSTKDSDEISRGLRAELSALGAQFVQPEQAAATVQIFLSENLQEYVWVAEIHQGTNEPFIAMVSLPRPETNVFSRPSTPLTIRKTPLWAQDERILDVVSLDVNGNPLHLVVLTPEQLEIYRFQDGRYQQDQSLTVSHSRPWPRDMRGRLTLSKDHLFDVYLPGVFCQSTANVPLSLACRESDDPWPLGTGDFMLNAFFSPTRNFFTGVLVPGIGKTAAPRFYSAAALPRVKYTLWLFSGVDEQLHLLDGMSDQSAKLGWGSGLASVKTGCGSGWQVLATSSGNDGSDSVRAFEFLDRDPVAVSQSLPFSGGITALWPEPSGSTAIVVSQNAETGKYEASRLSIACSQ